MLQGSMKIEEVAREFGCTTDTFYKIVLDWSTTRGIKVLHQEIGGAQILVSEVLFNEMVKAQSFFDQLICDLDYIRSHKMNPGREYRQEYIYFLLDDERVVYIGQTVGIISRLATHQKEKYFNGVALCQIHRSLLSLAEQANIIYHRPPLNRTMWEPESVLKRLLGLCNI